jgi:hypothetical protein
MKKEKNGAVLYSRGRIEGHIVKKNRQEEYDSHYIIS